MGYERDDASGKFHWKDGPGDGEGPVDAGTAGKLFQQWVASPPHRKALVSLAYNFVSTGVVQHENSIWAVQIFWATPREKGIFQ